MACEERDAALKRAAEAEASAQHSIANSAMGAAVASAAASAAATEIDSARAEMNRLQASESAVLLLARSDVAAALDSLAKERGRAAVADARATSAEDSLVC